MTAAANNMTAAADNRRRVAALLGAVSVFSLPALLRAAPAVKTPPAPPKSGGPLVPTVVSDIQGITLGMDLDDARAALKPLGVSDAADADKDAGKAQAASKDQDDDEGHQEAWTLRGTPYARLAFATDDKDKVIWVTGFVRPGRDIPFSKVGNVAQAAGKTNNRVLWNVFAPHGPYRVLAGGKDGKADFVSLIAIRLRDPNGIFSPQIIPKSFQGKTGTKK